VDMQPMFPLQVVITGVLDGYSQQTIRTLERFT